MVVSHIPRLKEKLLSTLQEFIHKVFIIAPELSFPIAQTPENSAFTLLLYFTLIIIPHHFHMGS